MATVYEEMRDAVAGAALELAKAFNLTASVENPGGSPVTVYVIPSGADQASSEHTGPTDSVELQFAIPRQTNFPPSGGIKTGAVLAYGSVDYGVERVDTGGLPIDLAPVVTVTVSRNVGNDEGLD